MLEILHMSDEEIAGLAARWPVYMLDSLTQHLVRVDRRGADELERLVNSGRLHRQDALVIVGVEVSAAVALTDELSEAILGRDEALAVRRQAPEDARAEARRARETVTAVYASRSYRIMAPLRALTDLLRRMRKRRERPRKLIDPSDWRLVLYDHGWKRISL